MTIEALAARLVELDARLAEVEGQLRERIVAHDSLRQLVLRLDQHMTALGDSHARSMEVV